MFPLKDTIRSRSFPAVNWLIIIANLLVFILIELPLGPQQLDQLILSYGLVPARATGCLDLLLNLSPEILSSRLPTCVAPLFTSMFLHGGWLHLISNLWALYIFGDNVEDRMGSGRYILFYLLSGVVAGLIQAGAASFTAAPDSRIPAIGASGAIAGVLAAYPVLFPGSRVITLVLLFFFPWFVEIPAIIYLGFWFVTQFFSGVASLETTAAGGVAYWAHIGGFIFGLLTVYLFARRPRTHQRWYPDEYRPW